MANLKVVNAVGERVVTLTGTTVMLLMCFSAGIFIAGQRVEAQPTLLDPKLDVRTVVSGLSNPTSLAFLSDDDILVLEKETGKVQRVLNGLINSTVLDLPVNFGSERGLFLSGGF